MPLGKVCLIGAGPGAADLLTLRAAERLARADVVLVDDLVDEGVLATHCARARIVRVGKRGGCRSTPQAFINRLMLRYARQGRNVARLKGGDPCVFGRGAEERAFLEGHGVEVEMVPGLTAGLSVPALAGIPVTHRELARSVTLVTGHTCMGGDPDWMRLAASRSTLVVYMGLQRIERIAQSLLGAGLAADTPAAVIAHGTSPSESRVVATLATIAQAARAAGATSPAIIVIGDVVAFARGAVVAPGATLHGANFPIAEAVA